MLRYVTICIYHNAPSGGKCEYLAGTCLDLFKLRKFVSLTAYAYEKITETLVFSPDRQHLKVEETPKFILNEINCNAATDDDVFSDFKVTDLRSAIYAVRFTLLQIGSEKQTYLCMTFRTTQLSKTCNTD